jgi:hypothetical protein
MPRYCEVCAGTGTVTCENCNGRRGDHTCRDCEGTGTAPCPACRGRGRR